MLATYQILYILSTYNEKLSRSREAAIGCSAWLAFIL